MTLTKKILEKYKKEINTFIETGSYQGDGISDALITDFAQIYSIEFYEDRYKFCRDKFAGQKNVSILQGGSPKVLSILLSTIKNRILFWLDAHYNPCAPESGNPIPLTEPFPLLQELEIIKKHVIKNHTILIDDRRMFNGKTNLWHNVKEEDIIIKLKEINPNYTIDFIDSKIYPRDIIVAEVFD